MTALPRGYDDWRLATPHDDCDEVGIEHGETCNRYHEPDEDAPRGYRPRPCGGTMIAQDGEVICDHCGELA